MRVNRGGGQTELTVRTRLGLDLSTLHDLYAGLPSRVDRGEIRVPGARILDAPRYAWRGRSLDVARTFFTVGEIRRVAGDCHFGEGAALLLPATITGNLASGVHNA